MINFIINLFKSTLTDTVNEVSGIIKLSKYFLLALILTFGSLVLYLLYLIIF